jgi:hypothetical protein
MKLLTENVFLAPCYFCFPRLNIFLNTLYSKISYYVSFSLFNSTHELIAEVSRAGEALQCEAVEEIRMKSPITNRHCYFNIIMYTAVFQTSLLFNDISCADVKPLGPAWSYQHTLQLAWTSYRLLTCSLHLRDATSPCVTSLRMILQQTGLSFHLLLWKRLAPKRNHFALCDVTSCAIGFNPVPEDSVLEDIPRI